MSIWSDVSILALRPLLPKIADAVTDAAGGPVAGVALNAVKQYLVTRFTDPSRKLPKALTQASDRAWRALEVAVAGESLWSKMKRHGEDKAFSAAVRAFLSTNPLALAPHQDAAFRRRAGEQFQAARQAGFLPGTPVSGTVLANAAAVLTRFADAPAQCAAEWHVVATIANDLRRGGYDALADLLDLRTDPSQPPLLAVAVRFFFRREIETNEEMFRGLVYEQVDNLRQDMRDGLSGLMAVLETHEGWLAGLLAVAEETRDRVAELQEDVRRLIEMFKWLFDREMKPGDSMSIRNETERRLVREVIAKYRALSEEDRRSAPDLLEAVARLGLAGGDLGDAQRDFQQRAALPGDDATKARAHYGAYLAAIERNHYGTALTELQEAARLAPEQYSPFPLNKYAPERILGAGGFGVVFLCRDVDFGARVAVKALRTDELDRDAGTVLAEAQQLETLDHENIIRLKTAGFANAARTRPYLVMNYFDGATLDEYVQKNGPLPPEEAREVGCQIATGLQAAHDCNILHRDVKPANILVRKVNGRWQLKLIDFGLALRRQSFEKTLGNVDALQSTSRGKSVVGTLDYAAPEQMGKLKGVSPGPRSDVYSFGRTMCYLLFKTPHPGPEDWENLTDVELKKLIGKCLKEQPQDRADGFVSILTMLIERLPNTNDEEEAQPVEESNESDEILDVQPVEANAPTLGNIEIILAPQPAPSDLPALPKDILRLEGRLKGLCQAIELIEQGQHPDLRPVWKALEGRKTSAGQPLIESLKNAIEKNPSRSPAQLSALAPDAPQATMLTLINAFRRLVELKNDRKEVEQKLHARQEEDFRGIIDSYFDESEGVDFPIDTWLKIQPHLKARRYVFVGSESELLQKAEQVFDSIREKREACRLRVQEEKAKSQRKIEAKRLQQEREKQAWRSAKESDSAGAYEEYLRQYPNGDYSDTARERASARLRKAVQSAVEDRGVRQRYLAIRTEADRRRDKQTSKGVVIWFIFLLGLNGAALVIGFAIAGLAGSSESKARDLCAIGGGVGAVINFLGCYLMFLSGIAFDPDNLRQQILAGLAGAGISLVAGGIIGAIAGSYGGLTVGCSLGVTLPALIIIVIPPLIVMAKEGADEVADEFRENPNLGWGIGHFLVTSLAGVCGAVADSLFVAISALIGFVGLMLLLRLIRASRVRAELGPLPWWVLQNLTDAREKYL